MPQSSHRFSWMGGNTHHIQAGHLLGLNLDGRRQLAHRSVQERARTPFIFNQHDHMVGIDAEEDLCLFTDQYF